MQKLPTGWSRHKLGDLIELKYGIALPQKNRTNDGSPVFGSNGKIGEHTPALTDGETLIIGRKGSIGEVHHSPVACTPIDTTYYIDNVPEKTFRYWFHSLKNLNLDRLNKSTAIPGLSRNDVYDIETPVPPINEQRRIADKLDSILARVDAANEHLSRVAPLIKRFRQSVLSAATSGQLTSDLYPDKRNAYERLPLGELASTRLGKMLDKKKNTGALVKYIRNVNVRWFSFDLSDLLSIRIEPHEVQSLAIQDGDVLICEGGEPGRCAVWREGPTDLVFQKAIHRARVDSKRLLPEWLAFCLKHQSNTGEIEDFFTGTTIKHLTGISLAKLLIPVPPIDEQSEIVRRVEKLFAFADRLEERLSQAQAAVQKLTPALLAKAFRGELVPQDPNDEPASELLKRLQESRTESTKPSRARKPRARKSS
jgi:hypothetical protein